MGDPDGRMFWDAFLVLAEASLRQAETAKLLTQRLLCKENDAALQPGRLDAAEVIAFLAGQIAQQADCKWLGTVGGREGQPNNSPLVDRQVGKQVMGTKRRVPSVLDLLIRGPPGGAVTDVAISLEDHVSGTGEAIAVAGLHGRQKESEGFLVSGECTPPKKAGRRYVDNTPPRVQLSPLRISAR